LPSQVVGILLGIIASSSIIENTSYTTWVLVISTIASWFLRCCALSISSVGCTKCSKIVSVCTPSSNCIVMDFVRLLAWVAHSSLESSVVLGLFQIQYCGCCPNLIKCSHKISTNLGLNLLRQGYMGIWIFAHLIFVPKIILAPITYHPNFFACQCPLVGLTYFLPSLQNIGNKNTPNNHKAGK
jgi:hypothetical protein